MKIAIVTGASSGMGIEYCKQISEKYKNIDEIWAIARRKDRLEELQKECSIKIRPISLDLSNRENLITLNEMIIAENPQICILVNNAGFGKIGTFESIPLEQHLGVLDVNCTALTAITYFALPYMPRNGRIFMMSSMASMVPQPKFAVYGASKAYVISLSQALNEELKHRHIRVTAVCPGPVKTEFFDVAESFQKASNIKQFLMDDAAAVVRKAMKDNDMGMAISIHQPIMKILQVLSKIIPNQVLLKLMKLMY